MKRCERCGVDVLDSLDNCPLCGGYIEEKGTACAFYENNIEPYVEYPALTVLDNSYRSLLSLKALLLIVIVGLICVFVNISLTPRRYWSGYVLTAGLAAYFTAIAAVYKKRRFYAQIAVNAFVLTLTAFLFDIVYSLDTAGNVSRFGTSLSYVVPCLLLAALILTDVMTFADRRENRYYLVTLLFVTFLSCVPQTVVWCRPGYFPYLTVTLFFFALLNGLVLTVICWKEIVRQVRRKFFL